MPISTAVPKRTGPFRNGTGHEVLKCSRIFRHNSRQALSFSNTYKTAHLN